MVAYVFDVCESSLLEALQAHFKDPDVILSFAEFMQLALYSPGGYYNRAQLPIGHTGDFITAPTISPLFSQCLAKQYTRLQAEVGLNCIVEFGAGTGKLAGDFIAYLEAQHIDWDSYVIVEISEALQCAQRAFLARYLSVEAFQKVQWSTLSDLQCSHAMVIANEVLDAMPVHLFEVTGEGIVERGVCSEQGQYHFTHLSEPSAPFLQTVSEIHSHYALKAPYQSEVCLGLVDWLSQLFAALEKSVVILIDYGFPGQTYYHPDRQAGTLMCHYQHRAHLDPLVHVGEQDITAHVDFTALAMAADEVGFSVQAYLEQASYLLQLGLVDLASPMLACDPITTNQAIKRLTLPHEMGELFKVMVLSKDLIPACVCSLSGNKLSRL